MILVHFHDRSLDPGGFDAAVRTFIWRFVESKSHGTFALLFGAGFAVLLRRTTAAAAPFGWIYLRRLAVLAVFGFVAHACFGFNVLLGYAVWGLPLLFLHRLSTRALIVVAVLSAASVFVYHLATTSYIAIRSGPEALSAADRAADARAAGVNEQLRTAVGQESYRELFRARLRHMAWFYAQPFSFLPSVTLTLFIVGLLAIRHRVFEEPAAHRRVIAWMMTFGLASWAFANWVTPLFGLVRDQWLTFTYVGGAVLLMERYPRSLLFLQPVASAGRMALTNYLLQIAALDLIFSGYALNTGKVLPRYGFLLAGLFFATQVAYSTVWMRKFRFGPAEWVWRSLAYGSAQPLYRTR